MADTPSQSLSSSRRHPHLAIDWDAVQRVVGNDKICSKTLLAGGACNTSYRVDLASGKKIVYRRYSRGSPKKDRHAMGFVAEQLPVPQILELGPDWALMDYLPGSPISAHSPALADVGRCLAVFSQIQFDHMGDITEDGRVETLPFDGFLGFFSQELTKPETKQWLSSPLLDRLLRFIDRHADIYRCFDAHSSFVHGDFNPGNILVEGDRVTGIIDWEFAMAGSPMIDTGNLLRHFGTEVEGTLANGMRDHGMPLADDWVFQSQLADLVSHIEFLSSDHSAQFKEQCVQRIRALLELS